MKTEPPSLPPSISPPPQLQKIYREIPSPLSRLRGRGDAAAAAIFCSESVLLFSWPGKLDSDSAAGEGTMCARAAFEGGRNEISPPPPSGKNNYACVRGFLCSPVIFEFPPFFFSHNHRVNSIKTELRRRQRRNARGQNYSKCRPTRTVHSSKTKIYITDRSPAGPLLPGVPWSGSMRGCCCCFRCRCRRGSRCCSRSGPWKHRSAEKE